MRSIYRLARTEIALQANISDVCARAGVAPCEDTVNGATPTIIIPHHTTQSISTTVHATTKLFVLFCSAQDDESADMNCLVFQAHCKNCKILPKH